jgi:hypothetical protein
VGSPIFEACRVQGTSGAHSRAPEITWHVDPDAQQSPSAVHASPSAAQVEVHENVPVIPGRQ